jgi:hypothetical protein
MKDGSKWLLHRFSKLMVERVGKVLRQYVPHNNLHAKFPVHSILLCFLLPSPLALPAAARVLRLI